MRRGLTTMLFAAALVIGARGIHAQGDGGYKLVPNWPKLPAGMYFGLKDPPLPPAERDAEAARRRAPPPPPPRPRRRPGRRRPERERGRPDESARHLGPGHRRAGSHLRLQP